VQPRGRFASAKAKIETKDVVPKQVLIVLLKCEFLQQT
jgi:hypothetical protein